MKSKSFLFLAAISISFSPNSSANANIKLGQEIVADFKRSVEHIIDSVDGTRGAWVAFGTGKMSKAAIEDFQHEHIQAFRRFLDARGLRRHEGPTRSEIFEGAPEKVMGKVLEYAATFRPGRNYGTKIEDAILAAAAKIHLNDKNTVVLTTEILGFHGDHQVARPAMMMSFVNTSTLETVDVYLAQDVL